MIIISQLVKIEGWLDFGCILDILYNIYYLALTHVILFGKPDMKNHNLINTQCTIVQEEDMYVVVSINLIGLSSF